METSIATAVECEASPDTGKLAEALAAAQGEIQNATVDSTNPHFQSAYTTLAGIIDAVRTPLAKYKIARPQFVMTRVTEIGTEVGVKTMLLHTSGEWLSATAWCKPEKPGPQAMGSVVTYLRRYSLAAVTGLAQADDDGESAEKRPTTRTKPAAAPKLDAKTQARIKILQGECGIEDREWREKLTYHYGVDSSAELAPEMAADLIRRLGEVKRTKVGTPAQAASDTPKSEGQG